MMTATETAVARLEAEQAQGKEANAPDRNTTAEPQPVPINLPVPANVPVAAKPAAAAPRPASRTSAERFSVTLQLDPHVHAHYEKKAKADDRTLAKYLARELRTIVDKAEKDKNF